MDGQWKPLEIAEVRTRFAATSAPWWIAGGIAIDLYLGWETRQHDDIDIEMFRSDKDVLFDLFPGWDLRAISSEGLAAVPMGVALAPEVFGVWGRPGRGDPWAVEVMLADGDMDEWRFRRDNAITLSGDMLVNRTSDGTPYCTPEVQLLYKSKLARRKDDVDLARCLHRMTSVQREWLADAISRSAPDHPWVVAVCAANTGSMNEA